MKLLFLLLFSFSSLAQEPIRWVEKGHVVESGSFLVTPDQMKKFREINEKKKNLEKQVVTLQELQYINEDRIKVHKEINTELEKQVSKEQFKSGAKSIGAFILGVLATSAAAYAAIQVSK